MKKEDSGARTRRAKHKLPMTRKVGNVTITLIRNKSSRQPEPWPRYAVRLTSEDEQNMTRRATAHEFTSMRKALAFYWNDAVALLPIGE